MYKLINTGLLLFRFSVSAFLSFGHGLDKFKTLISGQKVPFISFLGLGETFSFALAACAEFLAPLLVMLGLFTRISSLGVIVTMFVAAVIVHAQDDFFTKEKALLYLVSYILLFLTGPGKYSVSNLFTKKMSEEKGFLKFIVE